MVVLLLHLLTDAGRHQIPVQEIVLYDLPEKPLADKIDHGGVLDRRRLAVDTGLAVHFGKKETVGDALEADPTQMIQREGRP